MSAAVPVPGRMAGWLPAMRQMTRMDAKPQRRWFHVTPTASCCPAGCGECLLWLSNWLGWPAWHKGYAVLTCVAVGGVVMLVMLGWFVVALVFRGRFQFSIRSLLALVVVVALPCSWMAVEMKAAREQKAVVEAIRRADGDIVYDWS